MTVASCPTGATAMTGGLIPIRSLLIVVRYLVRKKPAVISGFPARHTSSILSQVKSEPKESGAAGRSSNPSWIDSSGGIKELTRYLSVNPRLSHLTQLDPHIFEIN